MLERLVEEIEKVREVLNSMVGSKAFSSEEILRVSQLLDVLIVRYYKEFNRYLLDVD